MRTPGKGFLTNTGLPCPGAAERGAAIEDQAA